MPFPTLSLIPTTAPAIISVMLLIGQMLKERKIDSAIALFTAAHANSDAPREARRRGHGQPRARMGADTDSATRRARAVRRLCGVPALHKW